MRPTLKQYLAQHEERLKTKMAKVSLKMSQKRLQTTSISSKSGPKSNQNSGKKRNPNITHCAGVEKSEQIKIVTPLDKALAKMNLENNPTFSGSSSADQGYKKPLTDQIKTKRINTADLNNLMNTALSTIPALDKIKANLWDSGTLDPIR